MWNSEVCRNQRRRRSCDLGEVSLNDISCFVTLILRYFEHLPCLLTDRFRTAGIAMKWLVYMYYSWGGNLCCQIHYHMLSYYRSYWAVPVPEPGSETSINFKVIPLTQPGFEPTRFGFPDISKRETDALLTRPSRLVGRLYGSSLGGS